MKNTSTFFCALVFLLGIGAGSRNLYAQAPAWWAARGILDSGSQADDYRPANQGQVKFLAQQALAELEPHANEEIRLLVEGFSTNEFNGTPVNLGQLKNAARPFYDRLIELGALSAYPWTESTADDADYAIANIGQVKQAFSFEITYNEGPSMTLLSPAAGTTVADGSFLITWTAQDVDDEAKIALYYDTNNSGADGTLIVSNQTEGSVTQYAWNCSGRSAGNYYIYAVIRDETNAPVTVYSPGAVQVNHPSAPTVTLAGPANGITTNVHNFVWLYANASDPDGNVKQVDFYVDGKRVGTCLNARSGEPYRWKWTGLTAGPHTFYARAVDTTGLTGTSATRTLTGQASALTALLTAESSGRSTSYGGHSRFWRDGVAVYYTNTPNGRGFNVLAYDMALGARIDRGQHFDTYMSRGSGAQHTNMINYISSLTNGTLVMVSVCDEAGLTYYQGECASGGFEGFNDNVVMHNAWASNVVNILKSLGSLQITNYAYNDSFCMIAIKGQGLLAEKLSASSQIITCAVSRTIGSTSMTFDYRDQMTYCDYWSCSATYHNPATPGATCHPGTDTVCAYVTEKHKSTLAFNSPRKFLADGMRFWARIDGETYEHMNVTVNSTTARWEDGANPLPGFDIWQTLLLDADYQIVSGANSMVVKTDHFPACNSNDDSVHFDDDGNGRGTFTFYTTDGDDDDDGLPTSWEVYYGLNPANPNDGASDLDGDGLSNLGEYNCGTNPKYFDTDNDRLNDGYEVQYGIDPVSYVDTTLDQDNDGVNNLTELIYGTNPQHGDTDGDGVGDGVEINQGSDPLDRTDVSPPASADSVTLQLTVGDPGPGASERYSLRVGGVNHQSSGYAGVDSKNYTFERGRSYTITIHHIGTDPAYTGTPRPDYDYQAGITAPGGDRIFIADPDGILGLHNAGGTVFDAAGKSATLYIPKIVAAGFSPSYGANGNETYPLHSGVTDPSAYACTMNVNLEPAGLAAHLGISSFTFSLMGDAHGASINASGTITPGTNQSGDITVRAALPGYADVFTEAPFVIRAVPRGIASTVSWPPPAEAEWSYCLGVSHTFVSSGGSLEGIVMKANIQPDAGNIIMKHQCNAGQGEASWVLNSGNQMAGAHQFLTTHAAVEEAVQNHSFPQIMNAGFSHTDTSYVRYAYYDPIGNQWVLCGKPAGVTLRFYREGSVLNVRTEGYGYNSTETYQGFLPDEN